MNEYQQALTRIIELEDKNAELLEALEIVTKCNARGDFSPKGKQLRGYTLYIKKADYGIITEAIRKEIHNA